MLLRQVMMQMNPKANILIDGTSRARLTGFGLTSIIRGNDRPQGSVNPSTATWVAPEVLNGGAATKEGDIFTYAMVSVEVCTGGASHGHFLSILASNRRSQGNHRSLVFNPRYLLGTVLADRRV